jgi:poly(3-hydroxybutyrate) depolymerase
MRSKSLRALLAVVCIAAFLSAPVCAAEPLDSLEKWLTQKPSIDEIDKQAFAAEPLTATQANKARDLLWKYYVAQAREQRAKAITDKVIEWHGQKMKYAYTTFGKAPKQGRSLYISMHGGGGAPARVNDQQWENQKRLYKLEEGVYLAPRAPTNTWNLWHQGHIDPMFEQIIQNLVVSENVNPNRVYLMGYSAGGDGVYQVAPRMADRLAAASMMAGHPNEASPLSLRNLPFTIHMGALDAAYKRNQVAKQWGERLAALQKDDPQGYTHSVTLHEGKGHWMDRQDAVAIGWMAKHTRNPVPQKVVWQQDDVTHDGSYWLALEKDEIKSRGKVVAERKGQQIVISQPTMKKLIVRLDDRVVNLNKPITIRQEGKADLFSGKCSRSVATLAKTMWQRGDPYLAFTAEVSVELSP